MKLMGFIRTKEKYETIILVSLLVIATAAIIIAANHAAGGSLFEDGRAGSVIRVRFDPGDANRLRADASLPYAGSGRADPTDVLTAPASTPAPSAAAAAAAAELASASKPVSAAAELVPASPRRGAAALGLLPLDFNLDPSQPGHSATRSRSDSTFTISKPLLSAGATLGKMDITIDGGANLLFDAAQARRILAGQPGKVAAALDRLPEKGLVSFADLRALGIDLRYSPTEDVIRLNP